MFLKNHIIRINLPGGIVASGDLYAVVEAAEKAGVRDMQFGTRQQLLCKVPGTSLAQFTGELERKGIAYESNTERFPNIVSSYVAEGVFGKSDWVSEGLYKDILDGFDYRPELKINLVESRQSFVPFFTGNLNFISSNTGNYWYLYIRFPRTSLIYCWKDLIYSQDIPRISHAIETVILNNKTRFIGQTAADRDQSGDHLYEMVWDAYKSANGGGQDALGDELFIRQPITESLQLPAFNLPYYEGFNRYGEKTWLGIYRRSEQFPLPFLKDICSICLQTKIGQIYTTPWKSLVIKGIEEGDRRHWERALNRYRINVRHASNELNWQVEDLSEEGLSLKRYLVRQLDIEDIRTHGLCFAIKTRPRTGLSGSVIIRKSENARSRQRKSLDRYDILYTPDFNANSKEYVLFRKELEKEHLPTYLFSLCKYYYEREDEQELGSGPGWMEEKTGPGVGRNGASGAGERGGMAAGQKAEKEKVFQCRHCLTIYDEQLGDPAGGEPPGRAFSATSPGYVCPVCDGPKSDFVAVEKWNVLDETSYL